MGSCDGHSRMGGVCLCSLYLCLWMCTASPVVGLPKFEYPMKGDGTLNLLVVGDWGRKGLYNQSQVAFQMGRIGDQLDIDFVISTGDNFYEDGLKGDDDPAFLHSFSNIYTANSLNKPWFAVLGNHDYRGDVLAQLSPALTQIDQRWHCLRSFIVDSDVAEFFFVDTTPFVTKYFTNPKDHTYDWRGVLPVKTYIAQLLKDVDSALRASRATWKIVVGHHPIRSVGEHGDTQELIDQLLPILQANDIDVYINGHDHCLERIIDSTNIQYLTSGGGSKAWRGNFNADLPQVKFYYDGQGFMSMHITQSDAEIIFYDVFATVVHKLIVSKQHFHPVL